MFEKNIQVQGKYWQPNQAQTWLIASIGGKHSASKACQSIEWKQGYPKFNVKKQEEGTTPMTGAPPMHNISTTVSMEPS